LPTPTIKREVWPRIRAAGGGRKKLTAKDADLLRDLDALVEPTTRGDPMSPLRWTCKSYSGPRFQDSGLSCALS
jgi:hypothetical protein